jgi:hypothetical protein
MSRVLVAVVLILTSIVTSLHAQEESFVFKENNFKCQIPAKWALDYSLKYIISARRPGGGYVFISAKSTKLQRLDAPGFMEAFCNKLISDGFQIVNQNTDPFEGNPAFSCSFKKVIKGSLIYTRSVNFIVGATRYSIGMAEKNVDPASDPDFQALLASFAILVPVQ